MPSKIVTENENVFQLPPHLRCSNISFKHLCGFVYVIQISTVCYTSKSMRHEDIYQLYSLVAVVIRCSQHHTSSLLFMKTQHTVA